MTLADRRWWLENTVPGQLARAQGRDPFTVDHVQAEAAVAETRAFWRQNYGRELTDREVEITRQQAEQRSAGSVAALPLPTSVPDLVAAVNSKVIGAGWRYLPEFMPGSTGIAKFGDGRWQGDPRVVEAAERGDAERRRRDGDMGDASMVIRQIGPPT